MDPERDHRFDFGLFIGMWREELDLSETNLAEACGVSKADYSKWERCEALPDNEEQVRQIALTLKLPEHQLLTVYRQTLHDVARDGFGDQKGACADVSEGARRYMRLN